MKTSKTKKPKAERCPGCGSRAGRCSMGVIYVPTDWWGSRKKPTQR